MTTDPLYPSQVCFMMRDSSNNPRHAACEQALLFGRAKRASRERAKGELATISHKSLFPPRKPRDSAKRENCHRKRATD